MSCSIGPARFFKGLSRTSDRERHTQWEPTWRPKTEYMATILAVCMNGRVGRRYGCWTFRWIELRRACVPLNLEA